MSPPTTSRRALSASSPSPADEASRPRGSSISFWTASEPGISGRRDRHHLGTPPVDRWSGARCMDIGLLERRGGARGPPHYAAAAGGGGGGAGGGGKAPGGRGGEGPEGPGPGALPG